jgi:hypothetical protein
MFTNALLGLFAILLENDFYPGLTSTSSVDLMAVNHHPTIHIEIQFSASIMSGQNLKNVKRGLPGPATATVSPVWDAPSRSIHGETGRL